jgi:hypothetical protein
MPASRIAFALVDLMTELRAITPVRGEDGPMPTVEVALDAQTFDAAVRELADRVGQAPPRLDKGQAVRFQGLTIRPLAAGSGNDGDAGR